MPHGSRTRREKHISPLLQCPTSTRNMYYLCCHNQNKLVLLQSYIMMSSLRDIYTLVVGDSAGERFMLNTILEHNTSTQKY